MTETQLERPKLNKQLKEKSATFVPLPIVHAVQGADKILGPNRIWSAINPVQEWFLKNLFYQCLGDISRLSEKEIKRKVSKVVDVLNKFLEDNGFSIRLEAFQPSEFGVVSILVIKVKWEKAGDVIQIRSNNNNFDGVYLKKGVSIFRADGYPNPIAQIQTQSKDVIYMSIADEPREGFDLLEFSDKLNNLMPVFDYKGVKFPMVSLDQEVDISWLKGMRTVDEKNDEWFISQAKQQTKFRMNEVGAIAESAVAIGVLRCVSFDKPLLINEPFFIAITRPGCSKPLFISYCSFDTWKNPGPLDLD